MYFYVKRKPNTGDDWTDPRIRKIASDAYDQASELELRDAAALRRAHLKQLRFAKLERDYGVKRGIAETPERIAQMRAIRRNMEKRIND